MKFDNIVSFSDLVALVTLVTICVTGIFSFIQYRNSVKTKRAEYMKELNDTIRNDKDIQEVMYKIDYNEHWYDEKFRNSGDFEYKVDKTLSYFSYLCYLRKMKMIAEKEFAFFKYRVQRIVKNKEVIGYFYDLYHFSKYHNVPFSFQYLFEYFYL